MSPALAGRSEYTARAIHLPTGVIAWAGGVGANCQLNVVDSERASFDCGVPRLRLAAMFGSTHRLCLERISELRAQGGGGSGSAALTSSPRLRQGSSGSFSLAAIAAAAPPAPAGAPAFLDSDYAAAYVLGLLGAELRCRGERRAVVVALLDMALRLAPGTVMERNALVRAAAGAAMRHCACSCSWPRPLPLPPPFLLPDEAPPAVGRRLGREGALASLGVAPARRCDCGGGSRCGVDG